MLLELILVATIIGIIEGIPLVKKKMWRELATVVVLIIIAIFLEIVKILGMPTPIHILKDLLSPLGKAIFKHP
jgi:ABC-type iron transport system FetAB permease component